MHVYENGCVPVNIYDKQAGIGDEGIVNQQADQFAKVWYNTSGMKASDTFKSSRAMGLKIEFKVHRRGS